MPLFSSLDCDCACVLADEDFNIYTMMASPSTLLSMSEATTTKASVIISPEEEACRSQQELSTASLNNQGVDCLKVGDWAQALTFFRAALRNTVRDCTSADALIMDEDPADIPSTEDASGLAHHVTSIPFALGSDFLHAVGFYLNSDAYTSDTVQNCAVQSAVVWYNLALLLHTKSSDGVTVECDDNKAASMGIDKALSLYTRSKVVLETLGVFDGSPTDLRPGFLQVLGMATFNNMAYALYQNMNWIASQKCLQDLSQWIFQMERQQPQQAPVSPEEAEFMEIFEWNRSSCLLNAMILQPPCVARAA